MSFEPDPKNAFFLRKHVSLNGLKQVAVYEAAVGASGGTVRFAAGTGSGTGHVSDHGNIEVQMCCLDNVVSEQGILPTHIKIDVEGGELKVLQGARETLARARPMLFLSTYGAKVQAACCRFLSALNYTLEPILGDDVETSCQLLCLPRPIGERIAA